MTSSELRNKAWYRFIKVIWVGVLLATIGAIWIHGHSESTWKECSAVCENGGEIDFKKNCAILYSTTAKLSAIHLCDPVAFYQERSKYSRKLSNSDQSALAAMVANLEALQRRTPDVQKAVDDFLKSRSDSTRVKQHFFCKFVRSPAAFLWERSLA
jgi:hypothetical protein